MTLLNTRRNLIVTALDDKTLTRDAKGFVPATQLYRRFHDGGFFPDYEEMVTTLYELEIAGDVYLNILATGALAVKAVGLDEWGKLCLARCWRSDAVHLDWQTAAFWSTAGVDTLYPLMAADLMEVDDDGRLFRFTPLAIHYMNRPKK